MCNRAILKNGGTLETVPNRYKTQEMCNKAVDNYPSTIKYVPDWYKTQEMCIRAGKTCCFFCNCSGSI